MTAYQLIDKTARASIAAVKAVTDKLGSLASKNKAAASDIDPTGGSAGQILGIQSDGKTVAWENAPQAGGLPTTNASAMTVQWTDAEGNTITADMVAAS